MLFYQEKANLVELSGGMAGHPVCTTRRRLVRRRGAVDLGRSTDFVGSSECWVAAFVFLIPFLLFLFSGDPASCGTYF